MNPQENLTEFHLSNVEQKAYELLSSKQITPQEQDFIDVETQDRIDKDLAKLKSREELFDHDAKEKELNKISDIFEGLLPEFVELYDWLGGSAFIIKTSRFDDVIGGIDLIAEFLTDDESNYLGLAIDITFSAPKIKKKVSSIASQITNGELAEARYFEPGNDKPHGRLKNICRVVVCASRKTISDLAELRLTLESLTQRINNPGPSDKADMESVRRRIKEVKAQLANHPFQFEILEQLVTQLSKFRDYAQANNQTFIADQYNSILKIVSKILSEKTQNKDLMNASSRMEHSDKSLDLLSLSLDESLRSLSK